MTRILVVDDEPDIVESLEVMLAKRGFEVLSASTGAGGFERAVQACPDLILLDVMMPVMDGFEVCRKLKESPSTKNIPVLLLTARNEVEDKVKGLEAGADDFVTKPFNDAELRARVGAFLRTKKLRDELAASYEKLKELERMRDSLTGMIVHDLKAPLTAIMGGLDVFLEHIEKNGSVAGDLKKLVKNAYGSSKRLVGLIQDILDVSRLEETNPPLTKCRVDVNGLARECVKMLEPLAAQAGIQLFFEGTDERIDAEVDQNLIERVLSNLISNSIKFTPPQGEVTVSVHAVNAERQVEIAVSDTGIGIPKEHLQKVFDKFFQSSGHETGRKGQGLGLTFCKMAVECHGGKIWAESPALAKGGLAPRSFSEGGSRFVVRLPSL